MKTKNLWRLRFLSFGVLLLTIIFGSRLFFLQVVEGESFSQQADRQYLRSGTTFFNRGSIFLTDRDGTLVPAATLNQTFHLSINPQLIRNAPATYQALSEYLELDQENFITQANHPSRVYFKITDEIDREIATAVANLGLRGVSVHNEKKRSYPAESLASHTLGFMAYDDNDYAGRYGLEKYYNETLNHSEIGTFASFFVETFLRPAQVILPGGPYEPEGDLILTIEPLVQNTIEETLEDLIEQWQAEGAGVIIMDPKTGDILAQSAKPDFNPGESIGNISLLANPLIERVFEMGSVIKALTVAAGLDAGVIERTSTYYDAGQVVIDGRTISNHDGRGRGTVDMQAVLGESLNTGVIHIAQLLGQEKFKDYFLNFGLGEPTGIDLPDEVGGLVGNLNSGRPVEYATASFGQGIALSPIGATRAFGALANHGQLIKPKVVRAIRYRDGEIKEIKPEPGTQVISRQSADEITTMLVSAVDNSLMGGTVSLSQFSVAAKTGTAQMPRRDGPGYDSDRFFHSFFGYYPAYEPRFVVFFYMINPRGVRYANLTLTEPFMDTARFLLDYYEVPPDR